MVNTAILSSSDISLAGGASEISIPGIVDVGANTSRPFVILAAGQSNQVGVDSSGDKTNPTNTYILNLLSGGTTLSQVAFGTAPLNVANGGSGTSGGPLSSCNNMAVHFANALRNSGMIPNSRPIVIIHNAVSGNAIDQWIGSGTSSTNWVSLLASIAAVNAVYPGFKIDHCMWAQGEGDYNGSGTAYSSKANYIAGFATLLAQWRALPQWTVDTTVSVQELGCWYDGVHRDRNDAIRTFRAGAFDRYVTTVSSSDVPESTASPLYHFSGVGLVTLGFRHFETWRHARIQGGYSPLGMLDYKTGGTDVVKRLLTVTTSGILDVADDDLRGSGCQIYVTGTFCDIRLPDPQISAPSEIFVYTTGDYDIDFITIVGTIESDFSGTSATCRANVARHYRLYNVPSANKWVVETVYPKLGGVPYYEATNTTKTLSASVFLNSHYNINGTATITTPTTGLRNGMKNKFASTSGVATITSGAGAGFVYPGGRTVSSISMNPNRWIDTQYQSGLLTMDSGMWSRGCQEATPTNGATVTCTVGIGDLTLHLLHSSPIAGVTITLPANPVDGACVRVISTSAVTNVTWSGGTTGSLVPPSFTTAQTIVLRYSATSSTWR